MWLNDLDGADKLFYTTGRLTSEMVIKVALMGIPILLSRSGITAMGLEIAQKVGVTLIARAKGRHFLVYHGGELIEFDDMPPAKPKSGRRDSPAWQRINSIQSFQSKMLLIKRGDLDHDLFFPEPPEGLKSGSKNGLSVPSFLYSYLLAQSRHQLDQVTGPGAVIELAADQTAPGIFTGAGRPRQAEI